MLGCYIRYSDQILLTAAKLFIIEAYLGKNRLPNQYFPRGDFYSIASNVCSRIKYIYYVTFTITTKTISLLHDRFGYFVGI